MQTAQHPLASDFDAFTTAAEVLEGVGLAGRVAIVTGGYSGLGLETAQRLAQAGTEVILPARSIETARLRNAGLDRLTVRPMDLLDHRSIADFAGAFLATGRPLHLLINSAGVMSRRSSVMQTATRASLRSTTWAISA